MNLKIAFLQLTPSSLVEGNIDIGIKACKKAKAMDADIAIFPEMWSTGYNISQNKDKLNALAINSNSPFFKAFRTLSKELNMAIGITYLEEHNPKPLNTFVLFNRKGEEVLHYSKVHTCIFGDERVLSSGDDFFVSTLNTEKGDIRVGAMICFDREFPESARILMLKGAELIIVPNACPMEINRLSQLRARAYENMVAIATCNYPETKGDCNGHSTLFNGIAYYSDTAMSRDMKIFEADEREGIFIASLDVDALRKYRSEEVHGNAYRRPEKYSLIISNEKKAPFQREDYKYERNI